MLQERLDQIYDLVTQLIRIVGNTNTAVSEIRKELKELHQGQEELRADLNELRKELNEVRQGQEELRQEFRNFRKEFNERLERLEAGTEFLAKKVMEHDMEIYRLNKRLAAL